MAETKNIQDASLNQIRNSGKVATFFLINGFQIKGTITNFDQYVVVVDANGVQNIIYKHAISTIIPSDRVTF